MFFCSWKSLVQRNHATVCRHQGTLRISPGDHRLGERRRRRAGRSSPDATTTATGNGQWTGSLPAPSAAPSSSGMGISAQVPGSVPWMPGAPSWRRTATPSRRTRRTGHMGDNHGRINIVLEDLEISPGPGGDLDDIGGIRIRFTNRFLQCRNRILILFQNRKCNGGIL